MIDCLFSECPMPFKNYNQRTKLGILALNKVPRMSEFHFQQSYSIRANTSYILSGKCTRSRPNYLYLPPPYVADKMRALYGTLLMGGSQDAFAGFLYQLQFDSIDLIG